MEDDERKREVTTRRLSADEVGEATWSAASAVLERVSPVHGVRALRLGLVSLLREVLDQLETTPGDPALINVARELVEALAHMPLA